MQASPLRNSSRLLFRRVAEHQISLGIDEGFNPAPVVVPAIRDEIAAVWSLPLGQKVEISLRGAERSAVTGILELARAPDYPWNPHQSLHLRIAGFLLTSRQIDRWTAL